ncbi:MAG: hypothetical protein SNJ85_12315 [Cyanobacteriota bacterium]
MDWHLGELLLPHILQLYKDYPFRMIALILMEQITRRGRPSNLLRVHLDPTASAPNARIQIVDAYAFLRRPAIASYRVGKSGWDPP